MNIEWSQDLSATKLRNKKVLACIIGLFVLLTARLFTCVLNTTAEKHKVGPNGFSSPWDRSNAPPPAMHKWRVKVTPLPNKPAHVANAKPYVPEQASISDQPSHRRNSYRRNRRYAAHRTPRTQSNQPPANTTALAPSGPIIDADSGTVR